MSLILDRLFDNQQESKREERKKLADEDAMRKIKQLEEQKYELQKQVANQKPVDGAWPGHFGSGRPFVGSQVCTWRQKMVYIPNNV